MIELRFQRDLQRVVHGAAAREKHLIFAQVWIEARKRAGWAWEASCENRSGIEPVVSVISDGRASSDGAGDGCGIKTSAAAKGTIGRRYRRLRVPYVQSSGGANVVCINADQVVQADVAEIVHSEQSSAAELMLHAGV